MNKIMQFLREVGSETRNERTNVTVVVISTVVVMASFFAVVYFAISQFMKWFYSL